MILVWFFFLKDEKQYDGFESAQPAISGTWASNECPPIPPCQACPCPMAKQCPSCNDGYPGYNKFGPSAITYKSQPGVYTCSNTKQQGYCVVDAENALSTCNADPKCLGFLQINPTDTTRMLISGTPSNYGTPNGTVYFEKTGNRPPSGSNNLQAIKFLVRPEGSNYVFFIGSQSFQGIASGDNIRITIDQITTSETQDVVNAIAAMNNQTFKVVNVAPDGSLVVSGAWDPKFSGHQVGVLGGVIKA